MPQDLAVYYIWETDTVSPYRSPSTYILVCRLLIHGTHHGYRVSSGNIGDFSSAMMLSAEFVMYCVKGSASLSSS